MNNKGAVIGYFIIIIAAVCLYFYFRTEKPANTNFNLQTFVIENGQGSKDIAEQLEKVGLIKNAKLLEIYAYLRNLSSKFMPGEYELRPNMTFKQIIALLTSNQSAPEKTITVIEGWTNKETAAYLEKQGLVSQEDFSKTLHDLSQNKEFLGKYDFLTEQAAKVEFQGFLFPDTYRVYEKTTAQEIIEKMLDNFGQKLDAESRAKIQGQKKTIFDIVVMASLLEKEAALDQDRRLIADIFWKRLTAGWDLESCATINYILGEPKVKLSFDDTRIPSPYNTYLHHGLPPGPIDSPGLSSIQAAIEPIGNNYCCFLSTPEGKLIFSRTVEEHNQNKQKYLK